MCGIVGWLRPGQESNTNDLQRAASVIAHRGPDDHGLFEDSSAGLALAHLRLSIIDLSAAGRQPMLNEDGMVAVSFNGEIYNFQDLREQLKQAGHQFRSLTDSEVLV